MDRRADFSRERAHPGAWPRGAANVGLARRRVRCFDPGVRTLGVDLGRVRIGLAVADDVLRTARALTTVVRRGGSRDLAAIAALAGDYEIDRAVLGLPLNMDGTEGASARLARAFAPKLSSALGVPVELFDERLSSFEAETRLRDRGFSSKDRRGMVDAEAAAVILQGWLDRSEP
jgi:putative Holliday junction resolvase